MKYKDGRSEIYFTNGIVRSLLQDRNEEITYPDGTIVRISPAGEKVLFLSNGQKEIHTNTEKVDYHFLKALDQTQA